VKLSADRKTTDQTRPKHCISWRQAQLNVLLTNRLQSRELHRLLMLVCRMAYRGLLASSFRDLGGTLVRSPYHLHTFCIAPAQTRVAVWVTRAKGPQMAADQHGLGERRADRASIFLDVLNVFLFFLQLFGGNSD
jgi:hypothetical protein